MNLSRWSPWLLFLLCAAVLSGVAATSVGTRPTAEAGQVQPAPHVNLDNYVTVALTDSLFLCRLNGRGPATMDCSPIPSGAILLLPVPREFRQGRSY